MPYQGGSRLGRERASKLGHLDVLKSPLVRSIVDVFEDVELPTKPNSSGWARAELDDPKNLDIVFCVDGSFQAVSNAANNRVVGYVKTALLKIDQVALNRIDREMPHPLELRDLLTDSAIYHATVFPLRHVSVPGQSVYDSVRQLIFDSFADPGLSGEVMETFKWIAYEKWDLNGRSIPPFQCPHCDLKNATLPVDAEKGTCPDCGEEILVTDMLGFHLEMAEDSAPDSVARDYMSIHETLLLFTGIRHFWENNRRALERCLFIKDGPLSIRAQYSKLVNPIRKFFQFALDNGTTINVVGQEKTGAFADHLELVKTPELAGFYFLPDHDYIRSEIQHRNTGGAPYGKDTNYGAKVFYIPNERHAMVLNIPTGRFIANSGWDDLIGAKSILAAVQTLLSSRFENALYPIELANAVASLSTYPSAQILSLFTDDAMRD